MIRQNQHYRSAPAKVFLATDEGFTFIEIMVTLAVLSVSIIMIYRALFSSLEHISHLNSRLYADILLEDRIATIERALRAYKALPFELNPPQAVDVGVKEIQFKPQMKITEVGGFMDVFQIELALEWREDDRPIRLSRSAYISDFVYEQP